MACGPAALHAQDTPPRPPPLPILDVSTMLSLILTGTIDYNDDPIQVNDFDIRFDDPKAGTEALDDLLEGK
jgi:hypothetical protein